MCHVFQSIERQPRVTGGCSRHKRSSPYLRIKHPSSSAKLFAFSELSVQCMLSTSGKSLGTCPPPRAAKYFHNFTHFPSDRYFTGTVSKFKYNDCGQEASRSMTKKIPVIRELIWPYVTKLYCMPE